MFPGFFDWLMGVVSPDLFTLAGLCCSVVTLRAVNTRWVRHRMVPLASLDLDGEAVTLALLAFLDSARWDDFNSVHKLLVGLTVWHALRGIALADNADHLHRRLTESLGARANPVPGDGGAVPVAEPLGLDLGGVAGAGARPAVAAGAGGAAGDAPQ